MRKAKIEFPMNSENLAVKSNLNSTWIFEDHLTQGKSKKVKGPEEKETETKYPLAFHVEGKKIISFTVNLLFQ